MSEIPQGYQKTKVGIIPNDWDLFRIDNILQRIRKKVEVEKEINYQQIGIRSHAKGIFHKELVTGKELGNKSVFWIEEDCFIVNIVFAWEQAVSKTTKNEKGMIASHRFPMYQPKDSKVDIDYLLYFFKSKRGKHLLGLASPGGAGRNKTLGQGEFSELKIPLPLLEEQTKVAEILITWDDAIRIQEEFINAKVKLKKGLMQKLLVSLDKELTLKEIVVKVIDNRGKTPPLVQEGNELIEINSIVLSKYPNFEKVTKYVNEEVYNKWFRKGHPVKGDILVGTVGNAGANALVKENRGCIAQNLIALRFKKEILPDYMYYLMNTDKYFSKVKAVVMGAVQPSIKVPHLLNFKFNIPTFDKQKKVAEILSLADEEIDLLKNELQELKEQKKGLMQKLLTGEVRVKV